MKIYVGNLSFEAGDQDLKDAFAAHGQVETATIVKDSFSGRSRGFGFVEMPNEAEARAAITALNGKELKGRAVKVNEAISKSDGRRGEGGGGRGRGGQGRGGRGDRGDRGRSPY
ncbi:MAG: RNA-binding protein [Deltaproteobacteria bacterium RBG_13_53_10]|nr:MAG: RNA-binding protein [Deltaproteobacteria bacterium RBG_13_53_10]